MDFIENIKIIVANHIGEKYPELDALHYPVYAKIMRKYIVKDKSFVDLRVLDKNNHTIEKYPEIPMVRGDYEKGAIVRVVFDYCEIDKPCILGRVE